MIPSLKAIEEPDELRKETMGQPLRYSKERPSAYWETVRDRIKCGKAVENLNLMLNGTKVEPQVERATLFTINKMLPSLQAVAMQIEDRTSSNLQDILNKAQMLGMSEADLFSTPETKASITQEKTDSAQD